MKETGFESVFELVGGNGRFQWYGLGLAAFLMTLMPCNHLGYIYTGAVPPHWCHIESLQNTGWTEEQIKNISVPRIPQLVTEEVKYDSCRYYDLNYTKLLEDSKGRFETALELALDNREELGSRECQEWSYDRSIYSSTVATEFNLVCGKRYLVASIQAVYMLGALAGGLVSSPLNDKVLGRRRTTLVAACLLVTSGFISAFSVSHVMFMASRFFIAMGTASCLQAISVWLLEHCDTSSRARMYCFYSMFFGVGYSLYAYFIRDWSHLQLAFSSTTLMLLSYFWLLPESPRWLATAGREEEAVEGLLRIAKMNRMPPPKREELMRIVRECREAPKSEQQIPLRGNGEKGEEELGMSKVKEISVIRKVIAGFKNFKELVATPYLRRISFTVWVLFVSVTFIYYGFAFSSVNLTDNPYLVVFFGALMEVPASVLPIPFLSRCGRRMTILVCYVLTAVAAFGMVLAPKEYLGTRTIFSMMGKLFVTTPFTVLYLVASESYPTVVRTTGQATGSLLGRFGAIAAPFVADMTTAFELLLGKQDESGVRECHEWSYDKSIYSSTVATEFNLVCGKRYLVASIQAVYMMGALAGGLIFSPLNDKVLGRRKTTLLGAFLVLTAGFISAYSVSHQMYMACRFFIAMGAASCLQAISVWLLEHCDTSSRARMYCFYSMFFGIGYAIIPLYAYFIRDWSHLQLAFSSTTLILLSFFFLLPESPRWLATAGREEEAVDGLLRIAKMNRMPPPKREELMRIVRECQETPKSDQQIPLKGNSEEGEENVGISRVEKISVIRKVIAGFKNFKELVATPYLRRVSFTVWVLFISITFIYYGFAFSSVNLTGNPYLVVFFGALIEVPASALPIPFLSRWGRRMTILVCYVLTAVATFGMVLAPKEWTGTRTFFSMMGKLFVTAPFTVLYLVASEVYPTVVRTTGQATGSLIGRIGAIAAPFVADMTSTVHPDLPNVIFGSTAVAAALVALLLPEMKDVTMKDQLHELEKEESGRKMSILKS